jgi:hypothetical protein
VLQITVSSNAQTKQEQNAFVQMLEFLIAAIGEVDNSFLSTVLYSEVVILVQAHRRRLALLILVI